jgi:hypothetical protein
MNKVGVNLAHRHQRPLAALADGSQLPEKSRPILFHRTPRILASESEIQALPAIGPGNTACAGAETMHKPRNWNKRLGLKDPALSFPESFQRH